MDIERIIQLRSNRVCQLDARFLVFQTNYKWVDCCFLYPPQIFVGIFVGRMARKQAKLLIYMGKGVVGGTGLEAVLIVSYQVIKCHIVSYL